MLECLSKMPCKFLKCGATTFRSAAVVVAILDVISTSFILVMFVLGSSLVASFKLSGNAKNATRVLDEITDDVFGARNVIYSLRPSKDVIEDIGVFFIITFLVIADFLISCIFLDGVKKWSAIKCQIWFDIRIITITIFFIVVVINFVNGSVWYRTMPNLIILVYRVIGAFIGYFFLKELHTSGNLCKYCRKNVNQEQERPSIIDLSNKRMEVKRELREMPIVIITGPTDEEAFTTKECDFRRANSLEATKNVLIPAFKLGSTTKSASSDQIYEPKLQE